MQQENKFFKPSEETIGDSTVVWCGADLDITNGNIMRYTALFLRS